jgi:hypothetical protein
MEIDLQPTTIIEGYTTGQVQRWLGVTGARLSQYCQLIRSCCPDEFDHPKGSSFYSPESYRAIKIVRDLFKKGATEHQIKTLLKNQGI